MNVNMIKNLLENTAKCVMHMHKAETIWDRLTHSQPQLVLDRSTADVAADSYHFYKKDVKLVYDMGMDIYRFSISWARILPDGFDNRVSSDGVKYYNNLIDEILKYNITPMVSMYHWELPQKLQDFGGWTNPLMTDYFEDYARVLFREFGDRVKLWLTFNEPHQTCFYGYGGMEMAPALNSAGLGEYLCAHHHLLAHARAYHLYDKQFRATQNGTIGVTMDTFWGEPKSNTTEDVEAAELYMQMHLGMYSHPIFSGAGDYPAAVRRAVDERSRAQGYSRSRLPRLSPREVALLRGSADFFGLNHYTSVLVSRTPPGRPPGAPSLMGDAGLREEPFPDRPVAVSSWLQVVPEGFRKTLNWIKNNYGADIPIVVTENGVSDSRDLQDYSRVEYFNLYLEQLLLALHEDGCNVVTYVAWSLIDSFEWLTGYTESFGLHRVDFQSPEKTRTPRLSATNLKEIVQTRVINFDLYKNPHRQ